MRRSARVSVLVSLAAAVALLTATVQPSGAASPLGQITTIATAGTTSGFSGTSDPRDIIIGPDGLVWFTDSQSINRINADGTVTSFDAVATFGANPSISQLVSAPDGNIWFTKFNPPGQIGKITPSGTMTAVTAFNGGNVEDIIVGPDGNLWYTKPFDNGGGKLGRITTAGVSTEFVPPNDQPQPRFMTVGSDGNIWYTDDGGSTNIGSILKATTAGAITLVGQAGVTPGLAAGTFPYEVTTGPDGNVWTVLRTTGASSVARVTPAGVVTSFSDPNLQDLSDITAACGNLYLTQEQSETSVPAMWQLTTSGGFTEFTAGVPATSSPQALTLGSDNDLKVAATGDPATILNMGIGCGVVPTTTTTAPSTTTTVPATAPAAVRAVPAFTG